MAITGETILITGASSGIGRALTLKLANHNTLIIVGRNKDMLAELKKTSPNIQPLVFDVSDSSQLASSKQQLLQLCSHLDRVILNAGNCIYLDPNDIDWSIFENMMAVNFFGWINTLQLTLDLLQQAKRPHIVGVASQVIYAPFSRAEAYGASKAAASYFLRSLALDLKFKNIDTSLLHPGFVDTPLTQKNHFPMPLLMSAEDAAERMLLAIEKRIPEYAFPRRLKIILALAKILPGFWFKKMAYRPESNEQK